MVRKYGLAADNNLSDVEDNVESLENLGFQVKDLYILQGTGAAEVTSVDYANCSGLTYYLENQTSAVLTRAQTLLTSGTQYIANSGDANIGTIIYDIINSDRGFVDLNENIYSTSSGSFFSTLNSSGDYSQGGQYKVGSVEATTLVASGLVFNNSISAVDWDDKFVKYKQYIEVKNENSSLTQFVPTYLAPPTIMQGHALWFDAEYSSFAVDGSNNVSGWFDVNGSSVLTQGTTANQPVLTSGLLNSKPGLVFNGNKFLTGSGIGSFVPYGATVVTIFRVADTVYNLLGTVNNNTISWREADGRGDLGLFTTGVESDFPVDSPAVGTYYNSIRIDENYGLEFRLNGYRTDYEAPTGFVYDPTGTFVVGRAVEGSTANSFTGDLYSICLFDRVLNDQELATIEEYFAWRFGFVYDPSLTQTLQLEDGNDLDDESDNAFVFG